jgi:hypothetical protein
MRWTAGARTKQRRESHVLEVRATNETDAQFCKGHGEGWTVV